jgi:hypothetical protein
MKQKKSLWRILAVAVMILLTSFLSTGCKKNMDDTDKKYDVRFSINTMSIPKPITGLKSTMSMSEFLKEMAIDPMDVTDVRIGIDGTHDFPLISKVLPFTVSDGITGAVKLSVGDHHLTSIELLKSTGVNQYEVLYSGVQNGSFLANFVNITLPVSFHIPLLQEIPVNVDVVAVDEWTPEDFGWAKFTIGFTTIYPIYFYGANDVGTPSVMTMDVYKGTTSISSGVTNSNGLLKVYFPDIYTENNSTEMYTFNLVKDGVSYTRMFSVEELLLLPREVHLLNVYGSGMMNFVELMTINLRVRNNIAPGGTIMTSYTVKNSMGYVIWTSGDLVQGTIGVKYPNSSGSDMITIVMTYRNWDGNNSWLGINTKTAIVSVSDLNSNPNPQMESTSNNWWLFI